MIDIKVEEIFDKIKLNIIQENRSMEEVKINDNLTILFDSLEIVELIMYAENEFEITIPVHETMKLKTFKDLCSEILMQIIRKQLDI